MNDLSSIHLRLEQGPSDIERMAQEVVQAKKALETAKRDLERARATVTIREGSSAKNTTILNALVVMDPEVDAAEARCIEANANHLLAVARHERAVNEFDGVRKQATLLDSAMRSGIHA